MRSRCLAAGLLTGMIAGYICHDSALGVVAGLASCLTLGELVALRRHFSEAP